jgi:sirohydrochlorin ferrochelatase
LSVRSGLLTVCIAAVRSSVPSISAKPGVYYLTQHSMAPTKDTGEQPRLKRALRERQISCAPLNCR